MTTAEATVARPVRPSLWGEQRSLTLGLLLIVTLVAFELLAVATVMPTVRDDLGGVRLYGWAFSAFTLASIMGIVWAGEQCDRRGPAMPFVAGLFFFAAGLTVAGLAPSMAVLVLGRSIQGLGAGVLPAVAWVGIGRGYNEDVRPRMLAWMATAWVVPGLVGPGIAAVIAETTGWRLVFLALLPLVGLAAWLALPGLIRLGAPATPTPARGRLKPAFVLAIGAVVFLSGLSSSTWYVAIGLGFCGVAIAFLPLRQLLPKGTLVASRGMPAAIAGHALLNLAFVCGDAFIPFAMVTVRGQSTLVVGVALSVSTMTWTAGTWAVERLGSRVPRRTSMAVGLGLVGVEMAALVLAVTPQAPVWLAFAAWCVGCLGMGIAYPSFSLTILGAASEGAEGAASAAMKLVEALGAGVGAGVGGALIAVGSAVRSDAWGAAGAFAFAGLMALLGILPALRSAPDPRSRRS